MRERVLVAGVSTRALAASAMRAGHTVTAVESFRDLDHPALPSVISLERDLGLRYSAARAARAATSIAVDAVCYAASFENDCAAVEILSRGRMLWGNGPEQLREVRNPLLLERTLRSAGFATARVRATRPLAGQRGAWLIKPRRSGGGQRIRDWQGRGALPRWAYLQERIDGTPGSLIFLAAGGDIAPLALTRQLIGDHRFSADRFRYVGNLVSGAKSPLFAREAELLDTAVQLARVLAERFGLIGLNGVDFIARGGVPIVTEVNPRWTGAAELVEKAYGVPLFAWHRESCAGRLPDFSLEHARGKAGVWGKAIAFARATLETGDTRRLLGEQWVADIPNPGERITTGQPICTLFANGRDIPSTLRNLLANQRRALQLTCPLTERVA